ncbi:hypothetical protein QSV37_14960 [Acinetobacter sp. VNK23]|uniref:hypothetical protein n=1 Tax=Acinetobacter thutiue TaxID=2998078 RepID=UPI0025769BFB|nr:hypothetical protein [Acinetobacter thutiue]MDM1021594.1 hypothetical protein [Acinetobacter thutiue]
MKTAAHINLSGDRPNRWGGITGNITDQADLNVVLDAFSDELGALLDELNITANNLQSQIIQIQALAQTNELKIGTKADQADLETTNQQVEQNRLAILTKADISALAQLALLVDTKADQSYVNQQIANLVGSAPEALNTIYELAAAIQNDQSLIDSLNQSVANRVRFDIATQALTEIQKDNARTNIGAEKLGTAQQLVSQITVASIGAATAAQGAKADTALQSADVAPVALSGLFSSLGGQNKIFDVVYSAYALGSNTAISVADTLGQMLGKLQAQIDAQKIVWVNLSTVATVPAYVVDSTLQVARIDGLLWIRGGFRLTSVVEQYYPLATFTNAQYKSYSYHLSNQGKLLNIINIYRSATSAQQRQLTYQSNSNVTNASQAASVQQFLYFSIDSLSSTDGVITIAPVVLGELAIK